MESTSNLLFFEKLRQEKRDGGAHKQQNAPANGQSAEATVRLNQLLGQKK